MFCFYLFVMLLLPNFYFAKPNCDAKSVNEYYTDLPKIDILGRIGHYILYPVQDYFVKFVPKRPEFCETFPISFGYHVLKTSLRPRGCCPNCCFVDNADKYVQIKFVNKNAKDRVLKLSSEKRKGKLAALGIKKQLRTILYLGGYGDRGLIGNSSGRRLSDAYLNREEDYNFLHVDWSELAALPWYVEAKSNAVLAAKSVAEFLEFYHNTGELPIENLHIIGFSLGAPMAGHVRRWLKNVPKIPRITGLDPALTLYSLTDKTDRLCEEDADFVDIIHTDTLIFGLPISIGHADFWPNRGQLVQPGCEFNNLIQKGQIYDLALCSHFRSVDLYLESLRNPKAFPVSLMDSQDRKMPFVKNAFMGFLANKSTTMGDIYLTTNSKTPYGRSGD